MALEHERVRCPNCPPFKSPSLSINRLLGLYHCFRCGISGKSKKIAKNFHYKRVNGATTWPEEYAPLRPGEAKSLSHRAALRYLNNRGITNEQIMEFRMGFCSSGPYRGRIVVPVFKGSEVVYFVARSISDAEPRRYMNPPTPKGGTTFKTFIGRSNIAVVVEGVFDAISVSRYLPAIALLSKNPTDDQIRFVAKSAKELIVMLDSDAVADSLTLSQRLSFYCPVRTIRLEKGDPGDLTKEELFYELFKHERLT